MPFRTALASDPSTHPRKPHYDMSALSGLTRPRVLLGLLLHHVVKEQSCVRHYALHTFLDAPTSERILASTASSPSSPSPVVSLRSVWTRTSITSKIITTLM